MDVDRFIRDREPGWRKLEEGLRLAEAGGLVRLEHGELRRLIGLYRQASSDLIEARARLRNAEVLGYLNALVGRAYAELYTGSLGRGSGFTWRSVLTFLEAGFPALLSRYRRYLAVAAALFLGGCLLGYSAVRLDTGARDWLVPAEHRDIDPRERVAALEGSGNEAAAGGTTPAIESATFSSFLFTHNIRVAFAAFALGITWGIGTVAVLISNGVMLGALAADYHLAGESVFFWAWILPHGIPEIGSILVAGAAGLVVGRSLVFPGSRSLGESFAAAGPDAVWLVLGTIPFFVFAGLVEGTLSQVHEPRLPYAAKLGFAALEAAAIAVYSLGALRRKA